MKIESEIHKLKKLIGSFFVESKKRFCHWGDCRIYSATRTFCDCGLLHRLNHLDYTLAEIVYPEFIDEMYIQDTGSRKKKPKKETDEAMRVLEEVFGKPQKPSFEELKMDYDDMHRVLNTVFSPKMFPGAFKRLDKWLRNEVKRN
jgi:hypothetical protein